MHSKRHSWPKEYFQCQTKWSLAKIWPSCRIFHLLLKLKTRSLKHQDKYNLILLLSVILRKMWWASQVFQKCKRNLEWPKIIILVATSLRNTFQTATPVKQLLILILSRHSTGLKMLILKKHNVPCQRLHKRTNSVWKNFTRWTKLFQVACSDWKSNRKPLGSNCVHQNRRWAHLRTSSRRA